MREGGPAGIKRDRYGWRAYVKVGRLQREKRYPPDTKIKTMQDWRDDARVALRKIKQPGTGPRNLLKADIRGDYLKRESIRALLSFKSRVCEVEAWIPLIGDVPRGDVTRGQILAAQDNWLAGGVAPKTINHRVRALRHVYTTLDGSNAHTPCDDVPKLEEPPPSPQFVRVSVIRKVAAKLTDPQTRARFMVLTATGQRPAQLKRAQKSDVDFRRRLWLVRPAKFGNPIPVPLTDDMIAAFKALDAAEAWGAYDGSDYAKQLYDAGWPRGTRPYNAKHTVAIALAESGADWEDIKDWFGHKDIKTTRIYTGLIASRLKSTGKRLEGRLGWSASRLPAVGGGGTRKRAEIGGKARGKKKADSLAKSKKSA